MRKIGIIYRPVKGMQDKDTAAMLRGLGFEAVFTGCPGAERVKEWADAFAAAGIKYESLHAPFDKINDIWAHDESGDIMLDRLIDCAKICADVNIPVMVVHLSSKNDAPCVNDIGHARWDKLIDAAVGYGVNVAFENQRKLANLAFVMELYRKVPNVGFCWDCGHELCFTPNVEYMKLFGDRLMYTHIHDNLGIVNGTLEEPDGDDLHLLPFDGKLNFDRFAELIRTSGYTGTLTLETCKYNRPDYAEKYSPEEFFASAAQRAKKLAQMCE